ncbi:MAG: beta-N-acetylhexosaminidase [Opitutaceae bacterium]|nr:beta-N-acetylhexosaminidase [Opitutaceae bacterium]
MPRAVTELSGAFAPPGDRPLRFRVPRGTRADFSGSLEERLRLWHGRGAVAASDGTAEIALGFPAQDARFRERCAQLGLVVDAALGTEGYVMRIDDDGVTAAANSEAGLFYALQTLRQILRATPEGAPLPAVMVRDWPVFSFRGVMDDISRGPLPNRDYMREQIRRLAELKINRMVWYIEDVVRVPSHPGFAPPTAIPLEEFRDLASYAAAYHVELVGGFQTLGHFEKILQRDGYADMAATHRMLKPADPRVIDFLRDVVGDMIPAFSSPWFLLNGDEAFDLGDVAAQQGSTPAALYAAHMQPLIERVEQGGHRAILWGDMALAHRELLEQLPRSVTIASWNYDGEADFDGQVAPFRQRGFPVIVCPGVLNSDRLSPDQTEYRANIPRFAATGVAHGAEGVLTTVWDDGGVHLFARDWTGVALGAEQAWHPGGDHESSFDQRLGLGVHGDPHATLARFLTVWNELAGLYPTWRMDCSWRDDRIMPRRGETLALNTEGWAAVRDVAARALSLLDTVPGQSTHDVAAWRWTVDELKFHADLRLALAGASERPLDLAAIDGFIARQEVLRETLRRLWFVENRDHWTTEALAADTARLEALGTLRASVAGRQPGAPEPVGIRAVEGQFFTYWLLTGPLDAGTAASLAEAPDLLASVGGEAKVAPTPGLRFSDASGVVRRWEKFSSELASCLDLEDRRADGGGVVYAFAHIVAAAESACQARIDYTGELVLIVNGSRIEPQACADKSYRVTLPLRAGRNAVLLKLLPPDAGQRWQVAMSLPEVDVRRQKHRYIIRGPRE